MARDLFCSLLSQLTSLLLQRAAKSFIVGVVNSMKPYHDPWRQGCRLFRTRRSLSNPSFSVSNLFLFFVFFVFYSLSFCYLLFFLNLKNVLFLCPVFIPWHVLLVLYFRL